MRWIPLLVVVLFPVTALAQDARSLIDEGVALREQGHDEDALERFRRAQELEPSPEALAQIALAEQALGRLVQAEAHLRDALAGDDRFVRRYRTLLTEALGEIGAQLGTLVIEGGVEGAELTIGGEARGTLPLSAPLRVAAGTARVTVRHEGYEDFEREVEVPAAGVAELAVALEPLPQQVEEPIVEPPPPLVRDVGMPWALPTGIAGASAGGVAIAVATALMVLREDHARARNACFAIDPDAPDCVDEFHQAVSFEAASVGTYVAGGVLLAAGAVLIVLELTRTPSQESSACLPSGAGVTCTF